MAIYVCEHCGAEYKSYGYDDKNFHENIIPTMQCKECKNTSSDDYEPRTTKYHEWEQI